MSGLSAERALQKRRNDMSDLIDQNTVTKEKLVSDLKVAAMKNVS